MQRKMTALVQQWERSTETRATFARRHGVTLATFEYWKRRVRREAAQVPTLAPVTLVPDQAVPATRAISSARWWRRSAGRVNALARGADLCRHRRHRSAPLH